MKSTANTNEVKSDLSLGVLPLVWLLMCIAVVLYGIMAHLGVLDVIKIESENAIQTAYILSSGTAALLLLGFLSATKLFKLLTRKESSNNSKKVVNAYHVTRMISFVLFTSVGIVGILVYFHTGSLIWFFGLWVCAIVGLVWARPKTSDLE